MTVTRNKYIRLHVLLLKDDYRALRRHTEERGWTLAWFVRHAIDKAMRDGSMSERFLKDGCVE